MTSLANLHKAVNLAQGFPDFDGPEAIKQAAIDAIRAGHSQYGRMIGVPVLNQAVADSWRSRGFGEIDPDSWVTITTGCTEAIPSVLLGLLNPGDGIILFEPFYDSYRACVDLAGARPRFVTLRAPETSDPDGQFTFDEDDLKTAFASGPRAILLNSPHNPTGKVFTRRELELIASLCIRHDVIAITDEVYEHLVYDPAFPHIPLATLPGMRDRTVTMSSLGKTFSFTGWKIGWVVAPPHLSAGVRAAHQFLTFGAATPLQHAAAAALRAGKDSIDEVVRLFTSNRDFLCGVLSDLGFRVHVPAGTYFIMADHAAFGHADDKSFCRFLVEKIGVAAIPPSAFYEQLPGSARKGASLVRFAFCKKRSTLEAAAERLGHLRKG